MTLDQVIWKLVARRRRYRLDMMPGVTFVTDLGVCNGRHAWRETRFIFDAATGELVHTNRPLKAWWLTR